LISLELWKPRRYGGCGPSSILSRKRIFPEIIGEHKKAGGKKQNN